MTTGKANVPGAALRLDLLAEPLALLRMPAERGVLHSGSRGRSLRAPQRGVAPRFVLTADLAVAT
jgi:hypothetical protein